ncbi:MAG: exodeoxyribonuclease V subunit alpha [Deltaproteobacteria bacterium]|jgi:exodeoxyribonuclease V alpha subunit|nr:exodeoxyribonuclease V subunit alpha [Deltaproteobacteria bacterium]MBW2532294.1 exodeoxyribonuclease V subunit alpha [Deltaproteobacteria bacterium]
MTATIDELVASGVLSRLDQQVARALGRLAPTTADEVLLGAAFASRAIRHGHVCADLRRLGALPLLAAEQGADEAPVELPAPEAWCEAVRQSELCASEIDERAPRPLVLDEAGRLYLYRYARYERQLAESIARRAGQSIEVDGKALREGLARLFPLGDLPEEADRQRLAALIAALRAFAVVSGGPGTGKTYTVAKILALLCELTHQAGEPELRIRLVAPTGKAAQRLGESIDAALGSDALDVTDAVRAAIPRTAATIHRALGYQPHKPTRFRHDADHPLPADVVLVDEASMVDVALMAKLCAAVPPKARLILLGDKDQLASVEAGAILGDIYGRRGDEGFSQAFAEEVAERVGEALPVSKAHRAAGIQDCMIHLSYSFRYGAGSRLDDVASAIRAGDADRVVEVLGTGEPSWLRPLDETHDLEQVLSAMVLDAFAELGSAAVPDKLALLDRFRILCAHRRTRFGVDGVNAFVEELLHRHGHVDAVGEWYDGRPIMITSNDYALDLFNGDVGVVGRAAGGSDLLAFFPARDGEGLRSLPPARLPAHETVFAMTVHKSQGSEFDRVALLLPEQASPLLTRELVYTGITRAKERVDVCGSEEVLRQAIDRRIERPSGLADALWGPED